MAKFYDANLAITKSKIINGDLKELEINGKAIDLDGEDITADTTVKVWLATDDDRSIQGFIFLFDADGNIIDDMEKADTIEVALFINTTGYDGYTTLSEADFIAKYGSELPTYSYEAEFSADLENTKLSCGSSIFTYNSTPEDITIFKLCALGRYN